MQNDQTGNGDEPPYELEERTFLFAKRVRGFVKRLPRTVANLDDVRQLVRASGSVAANYIEANENLGPKDFKMRTRIARKEAKESRLFLRLVDTLEDAALESERSRLIQEATELMKILSAIIRNTQN